MTQTSPTPTERGLSGGKIALIIVGACLVPILAPAGFIGWMAWDDYDRVWRVHAKPNAETPANDSTTTSLTSLGRRSSSCGRRRTTETGSSRVPDGVPRCDKVCGSGLTEGGCGLAFSDGVLEIEFDTEMADQVEVLIAAYVEGISGEIPAPDWARRFRRALILCRQSQERKEPSQSLSALTSGRTTSLRTSAGAGRRTGAPSTARSSTVSSPTSPTRITACVRTSRGAENLQTYGDAICAINDQDLADFCMLAGSDGFIVGLAYTAMIDPESLAAPLNAIGG